MISPISGIPVTMRDHGHDQQADVEKKVSSIVNFIDSIYQASETSMEITGTTFAPISEQIGQLQTDIQGTLEILAVDFGDMTASMALSLDGSVASTDRFLDTILGYDVAMSSSASITNTAALAADGNTGAMDTLRASLMQLGLQGHSLDVAMMGLIGSSSGAMASVTSMTGAISQLSNTPLDVSASIDVQLRGIAEDQYSASSSFSSMSHHRGGYNHEIGAYQMFADGGILTRATEFRAGMIGGEAGYPEAIIPLRHPKQMNDIEDKLDILLSKITGKLSGDQKIQVNPVFLVDGREVATRVMPSVDGHIVARNRSGVDPNQRAVY